MRKMMLIFAFVATMALAGNAFASEDLYNGLQFDGMNDYGFIPNSESLQVDGDLTIEAWIYPTNIAKGRQSIVFKHYDTEYEVIMEPNGVISFYHGDGSWEEIQEPAQMKVTQNQWNHISIVRKMSNKTIEFYLNGNLAGTDVFTDVPIKSSYPVYIGRRNDIPAGQYFFQGMMKEVRIWKKVRTQTEIQEKMHMSLEGRENGLVGYWEFYEQYGNNITDSSSYHNDGIIDGPQRVRTGEEIIDKTPPNLTLQTDSSILWPANHKLVHIKVTPSADDSLTGVDWESLRLINIESNEPDSGLSEEDVPNDIQVIENEIYLRAERSGKGDGREYTLTYEIKDNAGNVTTAVTTVTVPHDKGIKK